MKGLAWLVLLVGPLGSAPAAAGLWAHARFAGEHGAIEYALAAVIGVVVVEALLLSRRGVLREVAVLLLSAFWTLWLWLGMTEEGYGWTSLPAIKSPDTAGWMVIIVAILVYLTIYEVADSAASGRRLS